MRLQKECMYCKEPLQGRTDKKYCNAHCKSAYQYETAKKNPDRFYNRVDNQLKLNRKLLKQYNKAGKSTVRLEVLIGEGFNPKFFTHYWRNKRGDTYLFVYEYGFLKKMENSENKFVLITWQDYMGK